MATRRRVRLTSPSAATPNSSFAHLLEPVSRPMRPRTAVFCCKFPTMRPDGNNAQAVMGDTDLGRLRVRVARVAAQRDEAPGRARAHGVRAGLGASMDEGRQRF